MSEQMYCLNANLVSQVCAYFDIPYERYRTIHNTLMLFGGIPRLWSASMYNRFETPDTFRVSSPSINDCACLTSLQFTQFCRMLADSCGLRWQDVRQQLFYLLDGSVVRPCDTTRIHTDMILYAG